MMRHSHRLTATLLCVAVFSGVAAAQFGRARGGRARFASDADADAWEREGEDRDYFQHFSPDGYAVGINVLLYTMSH